MYVQYRHWYIQGRTDREKDAQTFEEYRKEERRYIAELYSVKIIRVQTVVRRTYIWSDAKTGREKPGRENTIRCM
jgi:hypothetical protein